MTEMISSVICARLERILSAVAAVRLLAVALVAFAFLPQQAAAHEIRPAIATLELAPDGNFALGISVNIESLIAQVGPQYRESADSPNAKEYDRLRALPPDALTKAYGAFEGRFLDGVSLTDDHGDAIPLTPDKVVVDAVGDVSIQRTSTVTFSGRIPTGAKSLKWHYDEALGPSAVRAKPVGGEIFYSEYVLGGDTSADISIGDIVHQSRLAVFTDYLYVGYQHIVPNGLDHILFVVGLFLLSPKLKPILWQVTCFTIAHTVTLALGALGIVRIPASIIEPLVALSIVYVAVENLRSDHLTRWRPLVVFMFGLLHGLGFASILTQIGPAPGNFLIGLVAFNVGVEIGQLTIVSGCFLAVGIWFGDKSWYRYAITMPASLAIGAIAGFWFIERVV